ncbi:hypothetical protein [Allocoleopsis sp.]|uniref:hypothetical protein n=1 Tax=Allocoleopsis sp. TaxID=3088169 RepID=UPI002FD3AC56
MPYTKREDFQGGEEGDVELLIAAGDLPAGIYKLKEVPDCAIVAGFVREIKPEDVETSPVNPNTPPILFATPTAPPPEILPKGETTADAKDKK